VAKQSFSNENLSINIPVLATGSIERTRNEKGRLMIFIDIEEDETTSHSIKMAGFRCVCLRTGVNIGRDDP
jgi:hypothetical protein